MKYKPKNGWNVEEQELEIINKGIKKSFSEEDSRLRKTYKIEQRISDFKKDKVRKNRGKSILASAIKKAEELQNNRKKSTSGSGGSSGTPRPAEEPRTSEGHSRSESRYTGEARTSKGYSGTGSGYTEESRTSKGYKGSGTSTGGGGGGGSGTGSSGGGGGGSGTSTGGGGGGGSGTSTGGGGGGGSGTGSSGGGGGGSGTGSSGGGGGGSGTSSSGGGGGGSGTSTGGGGGGGKYWNPKTKKYFKIAAAVVIIGGTIYVYRSGKLSTQFTRWSSSILKYRFLYSYLYDTDTDTSAHAIRAADSTKTFGKELLIDNVKAAIASGRFTRNKKYTLSNTFQLMKVSGKFMFLTGASLTRKLWDNLINADVTTDTGVQGVSKTINNVRSARYNYARARYYYGKVKHNYLLLRKYTPEAIRVAAIYAILMGEQSAKWAKYLHNKALGKSATYRRVNAAAKHAYSKLSVPARKVYKPLRNAYDSTSTAAKYIYSGGRAVKQRISSQINSSIKFATGKANVASKRIYSHLKKPFTYVAGKASPLLRRTLHVAGKIPAKLGVRAATSFLSKILSALISKLMGNPVSVAIILVIAFLFLIVSMLGSATETAVFGSFMAEDEVLLKYRDKVSELDQELQTEIDSFYHSGYDKVVIKYKGTKTEVNTDWRDVLALAAVVFGQELTFSAEEQRFIEDLHDFFLYYPAITYKTKTREKTRGDGSKYTETTVYVTVYAYDIDDVLFVDEKDQDREFYFNDKYLTISEKNWYKKLAGAAEAEFYAQTNNIPPISFRYFAFGR